MDPPNYRPAKCCGSCDHCSAWVEIFTGYRPFCVLHMRFIFRQKVCDDWKEGPLNLALGWK